MNQREDDEDTKLFIFDQTASQILNEIGLSEYGNNDNYFFNYTQVISLFSIKQEKQG